MDVKGKCKIAFVKHNEYGCNASATISKKKKDGGYIYCSMPISFNAEQSKLIPGDFSGIVSIEGYLTVEQFKKKDGEEITRVKILCTSLEELEQQQSNNTKSNSHFDNKRNGYAPNQNKNSSDDMPF